MDNVKVYSNGIIEVTITPKIFEEAETFALLFPVCNHKSTMTGEQNKIANLTGNLAESCFNYVFPNAERVNNYDFDFVWNDKTIDVKSKRCNSVPQNNFIVSVMEYSLNQQKNDYYVFARVKEDYSKCWILGVISKSGFRKKSTLMKEGDYNPDTNYTSRVDSYDLAISQLIKMDRYIK